MSKYNRDHFLRQSQRGWLRKQELVELKGGGCQVCGYNKCMRCLSFHHREPKNKSFNLDVRNIGNKSWKIVLEEFDKCDLLCMNCHGEHHDKETDKKFLEYEKTQKESHNKICLACGKWFIVVDSLVKVGGGKYCSKDCANIGRRHVVNRPTKEELEKLLWQKPTTLIGSDYGVSDKAVEKWSKSYGLTKPPRGYWTGKKIPSIV